MKKFLFLALATLPLTSFAIDGVSVEAGNGNSADMYRAGVQWNWEQKWFDNGAWQLGGYWEASAGAWRGKSSIGQNQNIVDIGFTPVFRLTQKDNSGLSPYVEGAIGVHLISPAWIYANRKFGSAFQFGDHVGAGVTFGQKAEYDLGMRFQHLSNGGIKKPNQGINFTQVRFAYHF